MVWLLITAMLPGTLAAGWFIWQVITLPALETRDEHGAREDSEVETLDAMWNLPVHSAGIHTL